MGRFCLIGATAVFLLIVVRAWSADRRAPPPKFAPKQFEGVFFEDVSQAIQGARPSIKELRGEGAKNEGKPQVASAVGNNGTTKRTGWGELIRPMALEDEVKRVKNRFDNTISTPAAFKSGGFADARRDLTILAVLFGIIAEHPDQVRWKDAAATARDLMARTASNCKAGSTQVFNEAKLRKQDLQDLISGSGLASRESTESNWGTIADRVPLMQYLEELVNGTLKQVTANDQAVASGSEEAGRTVELVAVLATVLVAEGMVDAGDGDYAALTQRMKSATADARQAFERKDPTAYRSAVGAIGQACDACHEQYR
jgi:hypothetical protein